MDYDHDLIPPEPNFFNAGFLMDKQDRFVVKDRETFFSSAQRSQIVWQILMRTRYDDDDSDKVGIARLLSNSVYKAAYPLHDGLATKGPKKGNLCSRRILYREWAYPWRNFFKRQPLWLIKRYFGDKIGLYFAWLGFYTGFLIPAALFGILVTIYGLLTLFNEWNYPTNDICGYNSNNNISKTNMCPSCETHCDFWELKNSCMFAKVTYVFDNDLTVIYALFMSFWATSFIEFWKRRQAVIAWEWDLTNFEEEEQTRPEYESKVKTTRINPVTRKPEPFVSPMDKALRVVMTSSVVLTMLMVVLIVVLSIMFLRISVMAAAYSLTQDIEFLYSQTKLMVSMCAAGLNLLCIVILNQLYEKIAIWLTNMEHPRTQTEYEDNFTFKIFLFQTLNFYSSLIYIAFFKGSFFKNPGYKARNLDRFRNDQCDPAGCMSELMIQLLVIMAGKQIFNNILEIVYPKLVTFWKRYVYKKGIEDGEEKKIFTRWENDYNLKAVDKLDLLDEYLELVIQYGFITLFVAAFPLAPFFALINNVVEIRLDAYKYVTTLRRPLAQRAQDIGAWVNIMQVVTKISVLTNALVIAFTSDFIPRTVYRYGFSPNNNLEGYVPWTLTTFNTSYWGNPADPDYIGPKNGTKYESCQFRAFKDNEDDYPHSMDYYYVLMARFGFVLLFQNAVYGLTGLLSVIIPDIPSGVRTQIQREKLLAREVLFETELNDERSKRKPTMIESKTVNAAAESKNSAESKVGGSDGNDNHLRNRKLDSLDLDVDENLDDVY